VSAMGLHPVYLWMSKYLVAVHEFYRIYPATVQPACRCRF
jgi:hypothetical protein